MFLAATAELLQSLLGNADQITVVPVRIVSVTFEMGMDRLDPAVCIFREIDPVCRCHTFPAE